MFFGRGSPKNVSLSTDKLYIHSINLSSTFDIDALHQGGFPEVSKPLCLTLVGLLAAYGSPWTHTSYVAVVHLMQERLLHYLV